MPHTFVNFSSFHPWDISKLKLIDPHCFPYMSDNLTLTTKWSRAEQSFIKINERHPNYFTLREDQKKIFSLCYQYNLKQKGEEKRGNHQREDISCRVTLLSWHDFLANQQPIILTLRRPLFKNFFFFLG